MASIKLTTHNPLPAPAILSVSQSKSHVLAGVQDAYWSDEEEDAECPLCLEEMDVSDLNFKPCVCGYQICRFCWHHIKENLNKRCPACRRIYTDDAVEFKPVATQDHKRLTQQKKQREREKKELETLGRKSLANVRVVQRNVVYVTGIGPRFAKEELIPTLRSNEYFGQYGKISKILIVKRTPPGGNGPVIGLYITYHRREDAARAVTAVDGAPSPGGGKEVMRASYGTTKYCMSFLRNVTCSDHNCMNLHEWGDEKDCFTKEDLTTLKHTMKTTELRTKAVMVGSKRDDDATLPRAASWAQKSIAPISSSTITGGLPAGVTSAMSRGSRRATSSRQGRNASNNQSTTSRVIPEKKATSAAAANTVSRPSTPSLPAVPVEVPIVAPEVKAVRPKKDIVSVVRETASPAPSLATESDAGSVPPEPPAPLPSRPASATDSVVSSVPDVVPIPSVPPGLSAPPGLPSPSRPPRSATMDLPQTPILAAQSAYFDKLNPSVRHMIEDLQDRRGAPTIISPFPDFDKTLQTLSENDGGFSFNLDPKLAEVAENTEPMAEFEAEANTPFHGTYLQAFPALQTGSNLPAPPGLSYPSPLNRSIYNPLPPRPIRNSPLSAATNYMGSFDPFAERADAGSPSTSLNSQLDDDRKVSRFGFARGRQGASSAASSPRLSQATAMQSLGVEEPSFPSRWASPVHSYSLHRTPPPMAASNSQGPSPPVGARFQPFDGELGEAQLREFIQASRLQATREKELEKAAMAMTSHHGYPKSQPFQDPAIMSASFGPSPEPMFSPSPYGPPPGLSGSLAAPPGLSVASAVPPGLHLANGMVPGPETTVPTSTSSPAPSLSAVDFPALIPSSSKEGQTSSTSNASLVLNKASAAAARKSSKKTTSERQIDKVKTAKATTASPSSTTAVQGGSADTDASSDTQSASAAITPVTSKPGTPHPELKTEPKVALPKATKNDERAAKKAKQVQTKAKTKVKSTDPSPVRDAPRPIKSGPSSTAPELPIVPEVQVPLLSKKPKKNKPVSKIPKPLRDDIDEDSRSGHATDSNPPSAPAFKLDTPVSPRSPDGIRRLSLEDLLEQIAQMHPPMDLANHPFFNVQRLGTVSKMPLEYGPLVHALSALSVGGGSFAHNVPSGSIDTAVSSFQQLLETLTQTISDLLRLLPRTTWDDSSSFDSVLRDMLKGDEFLDEAGEGGQEREDEVAALTLALERRARWMEVQLSKLEELHRDINTAAVRAVLSFNDNGWDKESFLPRTGDTLQRFDDLAFAEKEDYRHLNADELEKKLAISREEAADAEAEVRESMSTFQFVRDFDNDLA